MARSERTMWVAKSAPRPATAPHWCDGACRVYTSSMSSLAIEASAFDVWSARSKPRLSSQTAGSPFLFHTWARSPPHHSTGHCSVAATRQLSAEYMTAQGAPPA
eukprot:2996174-Pyramimonas_sp.AAC.2